MRSLRIQLWLLVSLLMLAALILSSCGRRAAQPPTATPKGPVAQATEPPAAAPEETVALLPAASLEDLLTGAQEALEAGDLDKVRNELEKALEMATGAQEAQIRDILEDLNKGEVGEVEEHLAAMLGGAGVKAFLHEAQEALEAGDLDKVQHELEEALEMASDVQEAQIEDILEDLKKGDIEEVEEHLAALIGGAEVSIEPLLHEALEMLEAGDLDKAKHELEEALELATDVQKDQIEDILADLKKGEIEEVREHLEALLAGTQQVGELALTGMAAEGHELFEQVGCAQCHGQNAEGAFGPALAGRTRDQVFRQVRTPVGGMPPFSTAQVSDEDLEKIAAFIEALTDERGFSGAAYRHLQTALEELEAGNIDGAIEAVGEAAEVCVGQAHAQVEEIEHLLREGNTHEAEGRVQALIGPGAARSFLEEALEALQEGNLDKVKEELEEALEVAEGPTSEVVEDLIKDLEKGELEEVEEHLKELLGEGGMHEEATQHGHGPEEHIAGHHDVPEEAQALKNPFPATEDSVAKGAILYARNCAVCHGEQGDGDGPAASGLEMPPANLHEDHVQVNSDGALFWIITHGKPNTPMPPWDNVLSEEERWHLVNFLRTFKD